MDAELRVHMRDVCFHGVVGNDERFLNVSRIAPASQKAENLALAFRQMGIFRKLEQPILKSLFAAFALDDAHLGRGETSSIVFENLNSPTTNSMYATRASTMHDAMAESNTPSFWHATFVMRPNKAPNIVSHEAMAFPPGKRRQRANGVARPNLNQNVVHKNLERTRARRKQRTRHGVARGASYRKGKKTRH